MPAHGHCSKGKRSRTYITWMSMVARCTRISHPFHEHYKARGIGPDPRWLLFENFLEDMGVRPPGCTLDRRDNDKGYSKDNCRWAKSRKQQGNTSRSRIIRAFGKSRHLCEWARITGIKASTIAWRLNKGWPPKKALSVQPKEKT